MFTREGQFIRYVATSTLLLRFGSAFAAIGLLEDGTIVGSASYKSGRRGGAGRLPVVAIDPGDGFTAASVDTLTTFFDADSRYVVDLPGIGTAVTSSPLDTSWFWVPDPLGDGIVTVDQPGIGGAPPDRYTVRWIGSDGAQRRAVSRGVEQVPLRGDIRNSVLESEVAKNVEGFDPSLERGPVERSVRRSLPLPDDLPAVSSLLAGTDGSVWVRREFHPGQPWTWDLFGRDGYVGSVRVPDHVTPQVVTLASMWGVELDPLDVPSICRFTVQAMPGDPP
jgi:hypothetical protein